MDTPEDSRQPAPAPAPVGQDVRARGAGIALAGLLLAVVLFAILNLGAAFGRNGLPTELAIYCELMSQPWDELGFGWSLGVPMLLPAGDTVEERLPYIHHPPAGFWPNYLGRTLVGKSNVGYRLFPVLATCLSALLVFLLARPGAGPFWAFLAALLFLASPFIQLFGAMPNSEPYTLLFGLVLAHLYVRYRAAPGGGRGLALAAWFLLGCQVDWQFYFLAPGIWVAEALSPGPTRNLRPLLRLFPVGVLGFLLVILHMRLGVGSFEVVWDQIISALAATQPALAQDLVTSPEEGFLAIQSRFFGEMFGAGWAAFLVLFLLLGLSLTRWRRDPLTGPGLMLLTGGVLSVVIFNRHSATHSSFWYLASPGCALLVVQSGRMVAAGLEGLRVPAGMARAGAALALVVCTAWTLNSVWWIKADSEKPGQATVAFQLDQQVERLLGPDICLCSPEEDLRSVMLYSRLRWSPPTVDPALVRRVLEMRDAGHAAWSRFVVVVYADSRNRWPEFFKFLDEEAVRRGITPIIAQGAVAYPL